MSKEPKTKTAILAQRERFEQAARELGVELDEAKLKEALRKLAVGSSARQKASEPVNWKDDEQKPQ